MGAVAAYAPDLHVIEPTSALDVGIKPGYWTEPTGLFLARLSGRSGSSDNVPTCTGVYAESNLHILPVMVQYTSYCIIHEDLDKTLKELGTTPDVVLWLAFIDGVLHGLPKKMLFNHNLYRKLNVDTRILNGDLDDIDNLELETFGEVLGIFRNTNNFVEGLRRVVNECVIPAWAAALYGQIAGAYYGITDIPEPWMDYIQKSTDILELLESVSNTRLKRSGTNSGISTKEKHVSSESRGDIATV
jgi:hypothetical protein